MRKYRTEITVENGMITVEGFLQEESKPDLHVQTYCVDTMDPSVRIGLAELGWLPPEMGIVGKKRFIRLVEEGHAKENKETQVKGDACETLQTEPN